MTLYFLMQFFCVVGLKYNHSARLNFLVNTVTADPKAEMEIVLPKLLSDMNIRKLLNPVFQLERMFA